MCPQIHENAQSGLEVTPKPPTSRRQAHAVGWSEIQVESAGYRDIVAFEDAHQLLAHRPSEAPTLAVVDSWTARFDVTRIHRALSGVPLVVLVHRDEHDEPWRSLGVTHLLRKPLPKRALGIAGFSVVEEPSGARAVPRELLAGNDAVKVGAGDGTTDYAMGHQEPPPMSPSAKSLEELLASIDRSVP